jgi:hypothetical protein
VGDRCFVVNLSFAHSGRIVARTIGNSTEGDRVTVMRGTFPVCSLVPGTLLFRYGV